VYWKEKEAAENAKREQMQKDTFDRQTFRSLTRYYREHDEDMVEGVDSVVDMLQHDLEAWQHLCDDLEEEFGERPVELSNIDPIWESEEEVRISMEAAERELREAEEQERAEAARQEEIRRKAAEVRAAEEQERQRKLEVSTSRTN